jgi:hypothetical protein
VTFFGNGLSSDEIAPAYSLNPGESLTFAFFQSELGSLTNPATATNLEIFFIRLANVELEFTAVDGGGAMLGPMTSTTSSGFVDISGLFGFVPLHQVTVSTVGPPGAQVTVPSMHLDHDCL